MKKILSLVLCLVMAFSLCVPAFAEDTEHPTIYVTGAQTNNIYAADGTVLYPISDDIDAGEVIKEALMPCLEKLALGFITDDYEAYAQEFYNAFIPIYGPMALDKNGEASNGSHSQYTIYNCSTPRKTSGYDQWDYRFWYDWRISPMVAADELKIYIDMVKEATGESKVNLMGRCYGANVIAAYITKYEDHAVENVDDIAYLSSSVLGIDMLSALFSGDLDFEDQAIKNFVDYFMENKDLIEDDEIAEFVLALVDLFNQVKVLGLTGDAVEALIDEIKYDLIPLVLRDSYGSMPSYWSMITPDKYEQAIEFVFGDCKEEYAGLIAKTDDYYYNVQLTAEETMLRLKEKGVDFQIVVKYDFPDYPLYEGATQLGDASTACVLQAFGGEYADYGTVFSDAYMQAHADSKYLSPDRKINAETCLFPENTWFIKGIHHETFPGAMNYFAINLMNSEASVSDGTYSQFQYYADNKLYTTEGLDDDADKPADSHLTSFIRFFKSLITILKRLFNGELDLGNLFG